MEVRMFQPVTRRLRPSKLLSTRVRHGATPFQRHVSNRPLEQVNPVGGFYESLLSQPLPTMTSVTRQPTTPSPPESLPKTDKEELLSKARVVFGSRLAGPAERRSEIDRKSTVIAGVVVPPRPDEPDNCCMGGCVNCVWDRYREEIEEWAVARKAADANLRKEKARSRKQSSGRLAVETGGASAMSMDDDGGGSETNWAMGSEKDLFGGIPIGILEFMKSEKRLKEKHAREGTRGG